jgi:hypothetical protein
VPPSCRAGDEAYLADRAAACQVRRGGVQPVGPADKHPGAERRVDLVPGEREVVEARRGEADAPVRDELRAVDGDPRAVGVREARELGEGQALPRHVGRAGDGQQRGRRARQLGPDRLQGFRHGRARPHRPRAACPCAVRLPGQQVRVVLDVQVHHRPGHGGREQVERVGGVPGEDHDVVRAGPGERAERRPGGLVAAGAGGGGVPGAPVHA